MVKEISLKEYTVDKSKNVTVTFRIAPEALALLRKYAPGRHGLGYLVSECVKAQLGEEKKSRARAMMRTDTN
jgi:hypothetical protein